MKLLIHSQTSTVVEIWEWKNNFTPNFIIDVIPDSNVHEANMGPTWVLSAPGGPHAGPMNHAIWDHFSVLGLTLIHARERGPRSFGDYRWGDGLSPSIWTNADSLLIHLKKYISFTFSHNSKSHTWIAFDQVFCPLYGRTNELKGTYMSLRWNPYWQN